MINRHDLPRMEERFGGCCSARSCAWLWSRRVEFFTVFIIPSSPSNTSSEPNRRSEYTHTTYIIISYMFRKNINEDVLCSVTGSHLSSVSWEKLNGNRLYHNCQLCETPRWMRASCPCLKLENQHLNTPARSWKPQRASLYLFNNTEHVCEEI